MFHEPLSCVLIATAQQNKKIKYSSLLIVLRYTLFIEVHDQDNDKAVNTSLFKQSVEVTYNLFSNKILFSASVVAYTPLLVFHVCSVSRKQLQKRARIR